MQLCKLCQKGKILIEALAEAEARIENNAIAIHAGKHCGIRQALEPCENHGHNFRRLQSRQAAPLLRASSGVHKHASASVGFQNGEHVLVPSEAAHVIHHLGS